MSILLSKTVDLLYQIRTDYFYLQLGSLNEGCARLISFWADSNLTHVTIQVIQLLTQLNTFLD